MAGGTRTPNQPALEFPALIPPKTARGRRRIVLPPDALAALKRHKADQAKRKLIAGGAWNSAIPDLVFENGIGHPVHPSVLTHEFIEAAERAGVTRLRFRDLRHHFASVQLAAGTHPKVVSEALGHATVGITLDVYSHLVPSMGAAAADAMQRAYDEAAGKDSGRI